jgi:hypothetical protein
MKNVLLVLVALTSDVSASDMVPQQPPPVVYQQQQPLRPVVETWRLAVMRAGPGIHHEPLGVAIPAGEQIQPARCVQRDDGINGPPWCLVNYLGMAGWISQAAIRPIY